MFKSERRKEIYDNLLYNFSANGGPELLDVLPDCAKADNPDVPASSNKISNFCFIK